MIPAVTTSLRKLMDNFISCTQNLTHLNSQIFYSEWLSTANEEASGAGDGDVAPSDCASLSKPFQEMHFTPKKNAHTPMKTLPFSPSQVCFLNLLLLNIPSMLIEPFFSALVFEQLVIDHFD